MVGKRVGVVGGGTMGSGIAEACIRSGFSVMLRVRTERSEQAARAYVLRTLARDLERGKIDRKAHDAAIERLTVTTKLEDLAECDLVIESVVEDLSVKRHLFAELDRLLAPDALLATNTSTLAVASLAAATKRPEKVVGIHFFNPVSRLSLVEVVRTLVVSEETVERASAFARSLGKEPITVADEAGFVVNALLFPYLNSAVRLLERHVASMEDIDRAMKLGCNFPIGPFALLDLVGLDVAQAILGELYQESGDPAVLAAPTIKRMCAAGYLGKKTGRGFYTY